MIKYPVRKTLETDRSVNRRSYNGINMYSINLKCNIDIPCDDGVSVRSESEDIRITLYPSYDRMGNYKGTMINCSFGWSYRYRGLRKRIREYDWLAVLEMFPSFTFRYRYGKSIKGIRIRNYCIENAEFKLKVRYDNFGPKLALLISGLQSITGNFSFRFKDNNGLEYTLDYYIHHNNSYSVVCRDTIKDIDLKAAFESHNIALSMCEKYIDNYIKEQHWSSCLEL